MTAAKRGDAKPGRASDAESEPDASHGSFEASLDGLEAIVDRLEAGDLPLEEALAAFEAGVALTRRCAEQLGAAERRIEVLVKEGANWVERPFEEPEDTE
jgi:exodeoxyribonuclease VII small subunit